MSDQQQQPPQSHRFQQPSLQRSQAHNPPTGLPIRTQLPHSLAPIANPNQPKPAPELPPIPDISPNELLHQIEQSGFSTPQKCINSGADLESFINRSSAYIRLRGLIQCISLKVTLKKLPTAATGKSSQSVINALDKVIEIIDDVAPLEGPRRFGNLAFRTFHDKLDKNADSILRSTIGAPNEKFIEATTRELSSNSATKNPVSESRIDPYTELVPYFLGSFGSRQRLDFGTGHELSFLAFFGGLLSVGLLEEYIEGEDILFIFESYFNIIRKLIIKYNLEPAGSHGVWGLDDHFHLPYILGSAQIVDIREPDKPTPRFPPRMVLRPHVVEREKETNLYFSAIAFINKVKKGAFHEHSPILYDITSVATWHKIHRGMIKMYVAEVLGKFPVVQHFVFGSGFFPWVDRVSNEILPSAEIEEEEQEKQKKSVVALHLLNSQYLGTTSSNTGSIGVAAGRIPPDRSDKPNVAGSEAQSVTKAPWAK